MAINDDPSPKEAEAIGLREAASWLQNLEEQRVITEVDAKTVHDDFHAAQRDLSEYGLLLDERRLLCAGKHFMLSHISRTANTAADTLAKKALTWIVNRDWTDTPKFLRHVLFTSLLLNI